MSLIQHICLRNQHVVICWLASHAEKVHFSRFLSLFGDLLFTDSHKFLILLQCNIFIEIILLHVDFYY